MVSESTYIINVQFSTHNNEVECFRFNHSNNFAIADIINSWEDLPFPSQQDFPAFPSQQGH